MAFENTVFLSERLHQAAGERQKKKVKKKNIRERQRHSWKPFFPPLVCFFPPLTFFTAHWFASSPSSWIFTLNSLGSLFLSLLTSALPTVKGQDGPLRSWTIDGIDQWWWSLPGALLMDSNSPSPVMTWIFKEDNFQVLRKVFGPS